MELIDSHAHIYLAEFHDDLEQTLARAKTSGVQKIYMPNINGSTVASMLEIEKKHPDFCVPMIGLHPCYVKDDYKSELSVVQQWLGSRFFCTIGEIGLDLYWDKKYVNEQIEAFELQINWAIEHNKPIVIHCRESMDMTIEIVKKHQHGDLKGIFHCFTGTLDQARQVIDLNFMLGIGGVATFKNGGLDKVLPHIGNEHIVLETDSPYLAPVPFRGKRNEPEFLNYIAEKIAVMKEISLSEIAEVTTKNALQIFNNAGTTA